MLYQSFRDLKLSALALGCMRFPLNSASDGDVNEAETARLLDCAMAHGINYYDTAWGYHEGRSELILGRLLKRYSRDSFYLADKFPGYDLSNMPKVQEIFAEQLRRCQVDYFDFYLFHNVCERNIDAYLDPRYGILDYLLEQKRQGSIRHLGFSAHGDLPVMERFLDSAMLAGLKEVSIIHGKGTGALRQAVHTALRRNRQIKGFRLGVYGEGEDGVTIVEI